MYVRMYVCILIYQRSLEGALSTLAVIMEPAPRHRNWLVTYIFGLFRIAPPLEGDIE